MATKKSKKVEHVDGLDVPIATDAKAHKKATKAQVWPKVVKGTHLTVYTYEDGTTKLEWDDEALLSEVRNAILKHESNIPVAKKTTRKKKAA